MSNEERLDAFVCAALASGLPPAQAVDSGRITMKLVDDVAPKPAPDPRLGAWDELQPELVKLAWRVGLGTKPYTFAELTATVNKTLDGAAQAATVVGEPNADKASEASAEAVTEMSKPSV